MKKDLVKYLHLFLNADEIALIDEEIKTICLNLFEKWNKNLDSDVDKSYIYKKMLDEIILGFKSGFEIKGEEQQSEEPDFFQTVEKMF